jgi:hypothetical protein
MPGVSHREARVRSPPGGHRPAGGRGAPRRSVAQSDHDVHCVDSGQSSFDWPWSLAVRPAVQEDPHHGLRLPSAFGMMKWVTAAFDAPLGKWGSEGLRAIWVARGPWSPRGWYYGAGRIAFAMRLAKASSEGVEHVREGLGEVGTELWGLDAYATLRENAGQLRESAWLLAKQESLGDSERLREALQGLDRGGACPFSYVLVSGQARLSRMPERCSRSDWLIPIPRRAARSRRPKVISPCSSFGGLLPHLLTSNWREHSPGLIPQTSAIRPGSGHGCLTQRSA